MPGGVPPCIKICTLEAHPPARPPVRPPTRPNKSEVCSYLALPGQDWFKFHRKYTETYENGSDTRATTYDINIQNQVFTDLNDFKTKINTDTSGVEFSLEQIGSSSLYKLKSTKKLCIPDNASNLSGWTFASYSRWPGG